jgi:3-polyprenyl-4-hydroxybenzoate decarboxylase
MASVSSLPEGVLNPLVAVIVPPSPTQGTPLVAVETDGSVPLDTDIVLYGYVG